MKKLLIAISLWMVSLSVHGGLVVEQIVDFKDESSELSPSARAQLADLVAYGNDYIVEKIDIASLCQPGVLDYHTMKVAQKRSMAVYDFLHQQLPGDNRTYELRLAESSENQENYGLDCVVITAYFLEKSAKPLANAERVLFPEEFPDALPTSMTLREVKGEQRYTLNKIYFEGNSAWVTDESKPTLEEIAEYLISHPDIHIKLEGHVNGRLSKRYLKKAARSNPERTFYKSGTDLSLARAETVKQYLVDQGVEASRIRCEGKGGKDRIYKRPKNERQNEANRRIEVILFQAVTTPE